MGTLEETGIGKLEVVSPLIRDGLGEHTEDWLIVLGAHVVTSIEKDGVALVAAQMIRSMATYKKQNINHIKYI